MTLKMKRAICIYNHGECVVCHQKEETDMPGTYTVRGRLTAWKDVIVPLCYDCYESERGLEWFRLRGFV